MIAPSIPDNEAQRLADLQALNILDTPPEERFDRITRLASNIFDVPIAYIALVDSDRQWFKAKCGLSADSTDRSVSFCGHTILQDRPLIIPDACQDKRFKGNPLVTGDPGIRFYAGFPLRGPHGTNVGTLCIADSTPRQVGDVPYQMFSELAGIAEHELGLFDVINAQRELIETKDELIRTKTRLDEELNSAVDYVQSLIPQDVQGKWIRVRSRLMPSSKLGGDFIGLHTIDDNHMAVYLLDVTGHGIAASLLAVSVGNSIRQQLDGPAGVDNPGGLLTAINSSFQMEDHAGRFVTCWIGIIDVQTGDVRYACAGHHPALIVGRDGSRRFSESDLPIGVLPGTEYHTHRGMMSAGDRLYLYSDGLYEVEMGHGGELGVAVLEKMIERGAQISGSPIDDIVQDVEANAKDATFQDDVSIIEVELVER